jgi:hypothetical protein
MRIASSVNDFFRDGDMHILIHDSPVHRGLSSPRTGERTRPDVPWSEEPATESDPRVDHDETLLVAALEVIESRRTALEWLLEADLLRLCLV